MSIAAYTEAWDRESTFYTQDISFDGYDDIIVMGWLPNNTIPYYYYLWNNELEQYEYLQSMKRVVSTQSPRPFPIMGKGAALEDICPRRAGGNSTAEATCQE